MINIPIYGGQKLTWTTATDWEGNFNIKNELIIFIGIYVKQDGCDIKELSGLHLERDMTTKLNIESQLELNVAEWWDGDFKVVVTNTYASDNELTVIILTLSQASLRFLQMLGMDTTNLPHVRLPPL